MTFTLDDATKAIHFILSVVEPTGDEDKRDVYSALAQLLPSRDDKGYSNVAPVMLRDNIAKLGDPRILAKAKKYLVAVGEGLHKSEAAVRKLEELMPEPQLAQAKALWKLDGKELAMQGSYSPNGIYVESSEEVNDLLYGLPQLSDFGVLVDPKPNLEDRSVGEAAGRSSGGGGAEEPAAASKIAKELRKLSAETLNGLDPNVLEAQAVKAGCALLQEATDAVNKGADVFMRDVLCEVDWSGSGEYWKVWNTAAAVVMDPVPPISTVSPGLRVIMMANSAVVKQLNNAMFSTIQRVHRPQIEGVFALICASIVAKDHAVEGLAELEEFKKACSGLLAGNMKSLSPVSLAKMVAKARTSNAPLQLSNGDIRAEGSNHSFFGHSRNGYTNTAMRLLCARLQVVAPSVAPSVTPFEEAWTQVASLGVNEDTAAKTNTILDALQQEAQFVFEEVNATLGKPSFDLARAKTDAFPAALARAQLTSTVTQLTPVLESMTHTAEVVRQLRECHAATRPYDGIQTIQQGLMKNKRDTDAVAGMATSQHGGPTGAFHPPGGGGGGKSGTCRWFNGTEGSCRFGATPQHSLATTHHFTQHAEHGPRALAKYMPEPWSVRQDQIFDQVALRFPTARSRLIKVL